MVIPLVVVHHFDEVRILGGRKNDINIDRIFSIWAFILKRLEELFCCAAALGDHPLDMALKELLVLIVNLGVPMRTNTMRGQDDRELLPTYSNLFSTFSASQSASKT